MTGTELRAYLATGGAIDLPAGNILLDSADAWGNGLTQNRKGTVLQGRGRMNTTVTIAVDGLKWGVVSTQGYCEIRDLTLAIQTPIAPFWAVGVSALPQTSSQGGRLDNVYVAYGSGVAIPTPPAGVSGVGGGAFAIGPDSPGVSTADLANWLTTGCTASAQPGMRQGTAYIVGNGTSGNILQNGFRGCMASFFAYGAQLAGSGITWDGGGFTGMGTADIFVQHPANDPVRFSGFRGEGGNMALTAGYVGPMRDGLALDDCVFAAYSPAGGRMIVWNPDGPLAIRGGHFDTIAGNTKFVIKEFGGNPITLTAIGVNTDVDNPYPAKSAYVKRVILSPTVGQRGAPSSIGNVLD